MPEFRIKGTRAMNDLIFDLKPNLGFKPEVVGYLASINETDYFYNYYNLRHPLGIFNVSFGYVINDFLKLLIELDEYQNRYSEYNDYKEIKLGRKLRFLFIDLFKFRDSLYEIIQACCKEHICPQENEPIRRWLDKNKYSAGKMLSNKIDNELHYFNIINNKLKHTSATIGTIYFYNKNQAIFGFYIPGISGESVGSDEMIHPRFEGMYTASSYNFMLRNLYYVIYRISNSFKDVIIKHFKDTYDLDLKINSEYNPGDEKERELFYRMSNLQNIYFPNEVGKPTYKLKLEEEKFYLIEEAAESIDLHGYIIQYEPSSDGFTKKFALLYRK